MQVGKTFEKFRGFLPSLTTIIEDRSKEAINNELKEFQDHQLEQIISEQGDEMIENRLTQLATSSYRQEIEEQMQEITASFNNRMAILLERLEEDKKERAKAEDVKEELREITNNLEEMRHDLSEDDDDFAKLLADFNKLKEDTDTEELLDSVPEGAPVAEIMGGSALTVSILSTLALLKNYFKL